MTDYEPIYVLVLTELDHPLVQDPISPIHIDFKPEQLNQIYRDSVLVQIASVL